jgi:phosphoglycolate phosphatase-like HAD superfamily hydrolase
MNLDKYKMIFWDFDGVIKETVLVKTDAFVELFKPFGNDVCEKIRLHHIENGGMSRYDKIPIYLNWSNIYPSSKQVNEMCNQFGRIVKNKVINSQWVPGVKDFLYKHKDKKIYVLVSATPQHELEVICDALKITYLFSKIYGAPVTKSNAIKKTLFDYDILPTESLMIGDSQADIDAANNNNINIMFRRHKYNTTIGEVCDMEVIDNFIFK